MCAGRSKGAAAILNVNMRQLIRVSDDIDRENLTVANAERCCLQQTIWIKAYIPGQAVNSRGSQQRKRSRGLLASGNERSHCTFQATDDFSERQQRVSTGTR